jgi:glycosyltransferase involved in cell wall biosynthesis
MLVSIIVPVYNTEEFLPACLDSLAQQSHHDIEVLLVNDGSTDGSARICDDYAARDKRFVAIHQENKGVSAARNVGIEKSRGDYIQFVDSDDFVEPEYTKRLLDEMLKTNTELSICSYTRITIKNNEVIDEFVYPLTPGIKSKDDFWLIPESTADFTKKCTRLEVAGTWGKLYQSVLIKQNHVRFDESLSKYEDFLFCLTYNQYLNRSSTISDSLYNYRSLINAAHKSLTSKTDAAEPLQLEHILAQAQEIYVNNHASAEAFKCLNSFGCSTRIGQFVRICNKDNGYSFFQVYSLYKDLHKKPHMREYLQSFKPLAGNSAAVPFFIGKGWISLAIIAAKIHLWRHRNRKLS